MASSESRYPFDELPEPGDEFSMSRRPLRRWDGGHSLLYFVVAALVSLLAALAMASWGGFYFSVIVSELVAFALIPMALRGVFDTGWRTWMRPPGMVAHFWVWLAVAVIAFGVVQSNLPVLLDRVWPIPREQFEFYKQHLAAGTIREFGLLLLVAAILPGLCEEIAFRGLIQTGLRRSFGTNHAIIWGGVMFALLHLNPWNFVGLWSFGVLLGYLRERTGSIYPSIAAHVLNNSFALIVFAMQRPEDWDSPPEFLPWYVVAPAGALLIVAVYRLHGVTAKSAALAVQRAPTSTVEPSE